MRKLAILAIGAILIIGMELGYSIAVRRYALPGTAPGIFSEGPLNAAFSEFFDRGAPSSPEPPFSKRAKHDARTPPVDGPRDVQENLPSHPDAGRTDSPPFSPRRPADPVAPPVDEPAPAPPSPPVHTDAPATVIPAPMTPDPETVVHATTTGPKVGVMTPR